MAETQQTKIRNKNVIITQNNVRRIGYVFIV